MTAKGRFRRFPGLAVDYVGDRPCIAVAPGSWVVLEGTSVALWELLAEPHAPAELVERLSDMFAGPVTTIEDDVNATLDEWERRGLVKVDDRLD